MIYRHTFTVESTLAAVRNFHASSSSMAAITPPPVVVRIKTAPQILSEGDEMDFTLWLLVLPVHWVARIENVSFQGFSDRQMRGPFKSWTHRHLFTQRDSSTVEVIDEVQAELGSKFIGWLVSAGMWASMPLLFAYRGWKTRRLLGK